MSLSLPSVAAFSTESVVRKSDPKPASTCLEGRRTQGRCSAQGLTAVGWKVLSVHAQPCTAGNGASSERSHALSGKDADSTLVHEFGVSMGDSGPGDLPRAQLPSGLGLPALTHSHSPTGQGGAEQGGGEDWFAGGLAAKFIGKWLFPRVGTI